MKDAKRRMEWFAFYDRCGMERHLEKMAEQGWMLSKLTGFYWQYRRITPAKRHFAITYFEEASIFDPVLPAGQEAYLAYCQKAGWHLAANSAQFQAFYSEEEDPVPIETDAVTQVANIHRVMMKSQLLAYILLLLLSIFQLVSNLQTVFAEPEIELANNLMLSIISMYSLAIFLCASQVLGYFLWYYRAKKAAYLDGSFYDKPCGVWIGKLALLLFAANMVYLIYAVAASRLGIIGGLAFAVVPAVICLGLLVSNLTYVDRANYEIRYDRDNSFLLDRIEVEDSLRDFRDEDAPQLRYTLTNIKVSAIYSACFDAIFHKNQEDWQEMSSGNGYALAKNPSLWQAEKVYQLYRGARSHPDYIVCWKDRIAEIQFYFDPTEKEIKAAAEALKDY